VLFLSLSGPISILFALSKTSLSFSFFARFPKIELTDHFQFFSFWKHNTVYYLSPNALINIYFLYCQIFIILILKSVFVKTCLGDLNQMRKSDYVLVFVLRFSHSSPSPPPPPPPPPRSVPLHIFHEATWCGSLLPLCKHLGTILILNLFKINQKCWIVQNIWFKL
jgi:hypothetical protein